MKYNRSTDFQIATMSDLKKKMGINKNIFSKKINSKELHCLNYPTKQDFLSILVFENISGTHIIDNIEFPIHERQTHVLFPNQCHSLTIENHSSIHQLFVAKELYQEFKVFLQFPETIYKKYPVIPIQSEEFDTMISQFKDIEEVRNNPFIIDDTIAYLKTKIIIQIISNEIEHVFDDLGNHHVPPILFQFILLTKKYCKTEKTVKYYADNLGLTSNHLNVLCKKYFNKTAKDCIQREIIKEIQKQIINPQNSLLDIALNCGFQCYTAFSKCIKKHLHIPPIELRKKLLEVETLNKRNISLPNTSKIESAKHF